MLALVFGLAALVSSGSPADARDMLANGWHTVNRPGEFIGIEQDRPDVNDDETLYAGLIYVDGQPVLNVGP